MLEKTLFVGDYMQQNPICLQAEMGILEAVALLLKNQESGAPVIDEQGNLLGLLTERDFIQVAVNAAYFDDFGGQVKDYMSSQVDIVAKKDNLMDLAQKLIDSSFRRFPVIEQGKLVGLITRRHILQALQDKMSF